MKEEEKNLRWSVADAALQEDRLHEMCSANCVNITIQS
jgi:hypothetical protein